MSGTAETADRYTRSTMLLHNDLMRPLTDRDAESMLGRELEFRTSESGTILTSGVVTDARVVADGRRLRLTVESAGQGCCACGNVYFHDPDAHLQLVSRLVSRDPQLFTAGVYAALPPWARVCNDALQCYQRRRKQAPMPSSRPTADEVAQAVLTDHQRHRGGCLCGWADLGKPHPGHQVAKLREAGLFHDTTAENPR